MIQIAWANGETKSSRMEHREDYFWLKLNLIKSANKFRTTKKSIGPKKDFPVFSRKRPNFDEKNLNSEQEIKIFQPRFQNLKFYRNK